MDPRSRLAPLALLLLCLRGPLAHGAGGEETPAITLRPAAPPTAAELAAVRRWHADCLAEVGPVVRAWPTAQQDLDRWPRRGGAPGCRALDAALAGGDLARVLPAPDFRLSRHLSELLWRLRQGAAACLDGRYFDAAHHLGAARGALLQLAAALRRYRLEP